MSIRIKCPTYEQYNAVDDLINEIHESPKLGLHQFYILLSGLRGFEDKGRSSAEVGGNSVRVHYTCTLTDRFAVSIAVRWDRVYHFYQFLMPANPEQRKFSVRFRDEFGVQPERLFAVAAEIVLLAVELDVPEPTVFTEPRFWESCGHH